MIHHREKPGGAVARITDRRARRLAEGARPQRERAGSAPLESDLEFEIRQARRQAEQHEQAATFWRRHLAALELRRR